ncbi:CKLF-like MARVEL transmembrane domain-containing protein 7 [Sebastes umbrosus]|uniref:CKLF-like MARVEL transmembrane domain-containing protein 7 n=1 Tax=Sebastes umbrosus TaxID=72105 RepID=UPI0018A0659C|nr:CKLF-like MARVEL transmembrane domain-containing protein 7 [Sebastes umbrosus]
MSHTVITTTTTTTRTSGDGVLNMGYTRTIPGLLKIGQLLALLVAFLCVHLARGWPSWAAFQYFVVVTLWFLIAFFIFLLMHLFRLQAKMPCINWPLTEFFHYSVGTVLILIASIIAAVKSGGVSALVAGSVFGFIATFLMAVSLWTSYSVTCGPHQTGAAV